MYIERIIYIYLFHYIYYFYFVEKDFTIIDNNLTDMPEIYVVYC